MSPIENLAARLARVSADFTETPEQPVSIFDPPPDGDYQALVHEYDWFEAGTPKQALLKIVFDIQNHPEYGGRRLEKVYNLEDPEAYSFKFLKSDLKTLGANVENIDYATDLLPGSDMMTALLDTPVLCRVKRPGKTNAKGREIVNVYIEARLGDPINAGDPQQRQLAEARAQMQPSDVPGAESGEFEHPAEDGSDHPFDDDDPTQSTEELLREAGCVCEKPLKVEEARQKGQPGTGHVDCPIPGHAAF